MGKSLRNMNRKKKQLKHDDDACSKINTIKSSVTPPWSDLTRSMNRKKKHDDACSKINTIKSDVAPWSDLNHKVLDLVMMKLGAIDFIAFSGVCKSWRSLALYNKNKFMVSRPPMSICFSTDHANGKEYCHLKDFEGRKFKTVIRHFAAPTPTYWWYIGVTCGYFIFFGEKSKDFWLVNLITRHELHFRGMPVEISETGGLFRAILVFSPSISGWVLVVLHMCKHKIWFCIVGKQEWTEVPHSFNTRDLVAFRGNIYTLHVNASFLSFEVRLCEMRLYPEPRLVLLETNNFPKLFFIDPAFVSSCENLYVIDRRSKHPYKIHEIDFGEMNWVSRENTGEKYSFFCDRNNFNAYKTFTLREVLADIHSQYGRYFVVDKNGNNGSFHSEVWYFLDDCLNVDLIHE